MEILLELNFDKMKEAFICLVYLKKMERENRENLNETKNVFELWKTEEILKFLFFLISKFFEIFPIILLE